MDATNDTKLVDEIIKVIESTDVYCADSMANDLEKIKEMIEKSRNIKIV